MQLRIPKLGMEMTEATISSWLVEDGSAVGRDDPLYVLETDKVETEIPSPVAGVLRRIGREGDTYPVGELIAEIEEAR